MRHFYDVGANIGQTFTNYLLPGAFRDCWITCFECSPRHLSALCAEAEKVRSRFAGITVVPSVVGAVGDEPGFSRVYEKTTPLSDSVHPGRRVNRETGVMIEAPIISLSAFMLCHLAPSDTVEVKLDVEGSEYDVLEDLLQAPEALSRITSLHVEWHDVDDSSSLKAKALTHRLSLVGIPVQRWPF